MGLRLDSSTAIDCLLGEGFGAKAPGLAISARLYRGLARALQRGFLLEAAKPEPIIVNVKHCLTELMRLSSAIGYIGKVRAIAPNRPDSACARPLPS